MKPTIKSTIPLAFLLFIIASVLFQLPVQIFSDYLVVYRDLGWYRLSHTLISSDGRVFYETTWHKAGTRSYPIWFFDETLQHPMQRLPEYMEGEAKGGTTAFRFYNVKDMKRISHFVRLIYNPYTFEPLIWWNGPKGQVDWHNRLNRRRLASLGPVGPAVEAPGRPNERFNISKIYQLNELTLLTPQGLYNLSSSPMKSGAGFMFQKPSEVLGLPDYVSINPQDDSKRLLIIHNSTLSIFGGEGSLLRNVTLPEAAIPLSGESCSITLFDNKRMAIDGYRKSPDEKTIMLLEENGSLIRRVDYNTSDITRTLNGGADRGTFLSPAMPGLTFLFPTIMSPLPWIVPGLMEGTALVQSIALSLVLASIVFWRQKRLGHRGARRAVWTAFVFLSGLLGFLTYLVAYWDRHSKPCPDCQQPRLVADETCPHCGADWPAPKPIGIEIIETA